MKKLNICLVALTISPDKKGGEAIVARAYFDYLKKQGHNVTVLTGLWSQKIADPDIVQLKLISKRFLWTPHFLLKAAKYLRHHRFDIIHANGVKGALPVMFSGKKRFITSIHDLGPFETEFSKIPVEKNLIKLIAKKSSIITTVSEFSKGQFTYFMPYIDENKIINIYNGIDEKFQPQPEKANMLKKQLELEGPILLYVGRIASYKGVEDIINAYYKVKESHENVNLIIGGTPDYTMEKEYQEWTQKYRDIYFVGFIPEEDLPTYYTMGDVFITYSFAAEGFGLTPIEAIACGTPVIASSIPVYREILQENAVLVPPKFPSLLAKEISSLLKDDAKKKNLVEKAQQFIQRYRWDEVGKKLENVYETFLELS